MPAAPSWISTHHRPDDILDPLRREIDEPSMEANQRRPPPNQPEEFEAVLKRVEIERRRLAPLLADIDPGDLHAILVAIFQPWGRGRSLFLRQVRPGVYVF